MTPPASTGSGSAAAGGTAPGASPPASGAPNSAPAALRVADLACERGGRRVFSGVSFDVAAGEVLVVTGPNGAGKSSLLRVLAGLLAPAGGSVTIAGGDDDLPRRALVHYLGHLDAVKASLSVAETLAFFATFLGGRAPSAEALDDALEAVGLADLAELPAGHLSAGQRRRLALARLVAAPRPVWLLDEPTAALDAASEARLGRLIAGHLAAGGLVVAATHQPLPVASFRSLALGRDAA